MERLMTLNERGWECNNNGKMDGDETGVDCGNVCPRKCGKVITIGVFLLFDCNTVNKVLKL